jgi:hypothetical protein
MIMVDSGDAESANECVGAEIGTDRESWGGVVALSGDRGGVFGLAGGNATPGGTLGESDCDGVAGEAECALSVFS